MMAAYQRLYHSGGGIVVSSIISYCKDTESPFRINKIFLPVKLVYFFFNAGVMSLFPYMPVFMTDLGLTAFQTGIARGAEPLLHIIVAPIWGAISDRFSCHKAIVISALVAPATMYFCTQFIPPVKVTMPFVPLNDSAATMATLLSRDIHGVRWQQLTNHNNNSFNIDLPLTTDSHIIPEYQVLTTQSPSTGVKTDSTLTFALMILLVGSGRFFLSPFNPIMDSTVKRMTKEHHGDFGRQRMFSSLGSASFSLISGAIIDAFGKHYPLWNKYTPAFYLYVGMRGVCLIPIFFLKFPPHQRPRVSYRHMGALFCQVEFLAFLLAAFTSGFSLGSISTFLLVFIADLGGPHLLMGLSITVTAGSSAFCMFFSSNLIKKLGHKNVFNLVLVCFILRHISYSLLYNPWFVLPIGVLHGFTFGVFQPACASYVNVIAPTGMEASVQTIAHSTYFGLGRGLGMIIGGVIFHTFGSRNMFRFFAGFNCIVLILLLLVQCYTACRERRRRLTSSVQYEEI